jgi:heat shock protein HslJ
MKLRKLLTISALAAYGLINACSGTSGGKGAEIAAQNSASQILTENDLANAVYRIDSLGEFRLDKGGYIRQYGVGGTQIYKVTLEKYAFGDLDHDGRKDAAVILAVQSGGSGMFRHLIAIRNTGQSLRQLDSVLIGDRIRIRALSIVDGQVNLQMLQAAQGDPVCCPSQQVTQSYSLHEGKWTVSAGTSADSSVKSDSKTTITGIVWKWERYEDTVKPHHFVIADPDKYTLVLLPNGTYRVKADCNRMQGQYSLDGRRIRIVPGAATLAECEQGSRYSEYLKNLTVAVNFVMRGNKLVLNLAMSGESLIFGNAGAVPNNR